MRNSILLSSAIGLFSLTANALPIPRPDGDSIALEGSVSVTPHIQFSSSVGVLGCKINTNRVAYWPYPVGCDNFCLELSYNGRSELLLRIDTSEGAHDISYDAFTQLVTGQPATANPIQSGGLPMTYKYVEPERCAHLLDGGGKVPLSASNSMNFLSDCLVRKPNSYVTKNYELHNIQDPICLWGVDERCSSLDWPAKNQADCPSGLGLPNRLTVPRPVMDIEYGTGRLIPAGGLPPPPVPTVTPVVPLPTTSTTAVVPLPTPTVAVPPVVADTGSGFVVATAEAVVDTTLPSVTSTEVLIPITLKARAVRVAQRGVAWFKS